MGMSFQNNNNYHFISRFGPSQSLHHWWLGRSQSSQGQTHACTVYVQRIYAAFEFQVLPHVDDSQTSES